MNVLMALEDLPGRRCHHQYPHPTSSFNPESSSGQGLDKDCSGQRPACNVWVLDFMSERFCDTGSDGFEGMCINAGTMKQRKILGEKEQGEPRWCSQSVL